MRRSLSVLAASLGAVAMLLGCGGDDGGSGGAAASASQSVTTGAGGATSSSDATTGTGGSGGAPECLDAADCDDGDACTVDACEAEACTHTDAVIEDDDACTVDSCDPAVGVAHDPVDPNDGIACTVDTCDPATGSASTPDDALCGAIEFCDALLDCQTVPLTDVVITEMMPFGSAGNAGEFIELFNPTASAGSVHDFTIKNALGLSATIFAASDPTGASHAAVTLMPGETAYGVPNPLDPAAIPAGAAFVYGDPGTAWEIGDAGDALILSDKLGAPIDVVDFVTPLAGSVPAFQADPALPVLAGQFPGYAGASMQLDPSSLTSSANDVGDAWCVTFRAPDTAGLPNAPCNDFVLNEVLYDYEHPIHGPSDEGFTFIELAGPGGGDLSGVLVRGIDGGGNLIQTPDATLPAGTRMPVDGLFVLADADANNVTFVPNADFISQNSDPENGAAGDGLQLFLPGSVLKDQLGYGPSVSVFETAPVPSLGPDRIALSLGRDAASTDTDDNLADFHFDPTPTPGDPNLPVVPQIITYAPSTVLATVGGGVFLTTHDFADIKGLNGVASADNDINATFAGIVTVDTTAFNDGCTILDIQNDGRGDASLFCFAPTNAGVPVHGDLVLASPAALGGTVTVMNGFTYTGVQNETDLPEEADFCNLQFPSSFALQSGQMSPLIYGRIYEAALTPAAGADPSISAQLGYGPFASDPTMQSGWVFVDAPFNVQVGNDDEYQASLIAPTVLAQTQFAYTFRFSFDGGLTYTYCDLDGAGSDPGLTVTNGQFGLMTVDP